MNRAWAFVWSVGLLIALPGFALSQMGERGDFVLLRGSDTVSVERFVIGRGDLRSDITAATSTRVTIGAWLTAVGFVDSVRVVGNVGFDRMLLSASFGEHRVRLATRTNGDDRRQEITTAQRVGAVYPNSFALIEQFLRATHLTVGTRAEIHALVLDAPDTTTYLIFRPSADSIIITAGRSVMQLVVAADWSIHGGRQMPGNHMLIRRSPTKAPECGDRPRAAIDFLNLPGMGFEAEPSPDGCWFFAPLVSTTLGWRSGIAVFKRMGGDLTLERVLPIDHGPATLIGMTHDGQLLVVPDGGRSVTFIDVERLLAARADAAIGQLSLGGRRTGGSNVGLTPDDHYLFVTDEPNATISVIDLAKARRTNFDSQSVVGRIPTGRDPIAAAVSPDGKRVYAANEEVAPALGWPIECRPQRWATMTNPSPDHRQGAILVIDAVRAVTDPELSVISVAPAGCDPARLELSPEGDVAYVPARTDNALLAFDTQKLVTDPTHALVAKVTTGPAPSGLTVSADGRTVYVTNSNRFGCGGGPCVDSASTVSVIDVTRVREGVAMTLGTIPTRSSPTDPHVTPDGRSLILGNVGVNVLEIVDLTALPFRIPGVPRP